ncbi:MAG: hypothetical protein AABW73_04660 [Nanoarchaeota archaeon]
MSNLLKRSPDEMDYWSTSRLGAAFINYFSESRRNPEDLEQLEIVAELLSKRPLSERMGVVRMIEGHMKDNCVEEDYKRAAVLREALRYYEVKALG